MPATPRRSRRDSEDADTKNSPASTRSTRTTPGKRTPGKSTPAKGTPGKRTPAKGTPGKRTPAKGTPGKCTPGRTPRGQKSKSSERDLAKSPPSKRANLDESMGDFVPLPSSPKTDAPLFSSPPGRSGASEFNLSSPLRYGIPSSNNGTPKTPGLAATPIRARVDVRNERKMRMVDIGESSEAGHPSGAGSEPSSDVGIGHQVIWGTDVSVNECKDKMRRFILSFILRDVEMDEKFDGMDVEEPIYLQRLEEINMIGDPFLNVNASHLHQFDAKLYRQLIHYPQEVIPTMDMAVNQLFFEKFPDTALEHQIQVRPYNADITSDMRSLNPDDIDQLITIKGMVIRTSNLIPELGEAFFQCGVCKATRSIEVERGRILEPTLCQACNTNHSYQMIHNRSRFSDKQMVKLQESPDDMPAGQTPHTIIVFSHNDLVDKVQPGDRVTVTGIYRAQPLRVNPIQRNIRAAFKTYIDVIHYRKLDGDRLASTDDENPNQLRLGDERIEQIKQLQAQPDVYEKLASALAPSIYENIDIKKGILLQLFGGAKKDFSTAGRGHARADINILLCGDPGTSKSQLLQYVYRLVPRGQYTSGKGSSAVGLTAYITKDPETRQMVLQTGALVLSDNGICCIDEFDKMSDSTRSVLHEVMEQQTLSIAKAGIICSLNARTAILAAANPVESQWNQKKTIIDNIQLSHTLLSRFDLIFLILDPQDETFDRKLSYHLVSLYYKTAEKEASDLMDSELLKDYICYAKTYITPTISEKAGQALVSSYVKMRKIGSGRGQISAYPRQLESLIRLAEAHAKMRLSSTVEECDVMEAERLHREALKQAAVDPATGKIDISILTTGTSSASRRQRAERAQALRTLLREKDKAPMHSYQRLFEDFKLRSDTFLSRDMFDEALKDLSDDGEIIRTGNTVRLCS